MLCQSRVIGTICFGLLSIASSTLAQAVAEPSNDPRIIDRILVKVNGEIITQTDLEARQISEIRSRGVQPRSNVELSNIIQEVTPSLIATAVDELLLVQRGRDLGYQLSDDQFSEIVVNLKSENEFETDEELEQALEESEGITMADLRRLMEHQMLVSQVQQVEILSRVAITDIEAREYYDTHIEEFTAPATATLREILIAVPEGSASVDNESRVVAETTVARVRGGEGFAMVAAEVSDSGSKSNGGLIGPLLISEYSDTIQELIASLEVGEVADPIRAAQGYQVVMLEARTDASAVPFDNVRDGISSNVFNDRRLGEYTKYLKSLRTEAIIEWKNDDLRRLYEDYRESGANTTESSRLPFPE